MTGIEHLYLHAPLCRERCRYCTYKVGTGSASDLERWSEGVKGELRIRKAKEVLTSPLRTLLFGGGTPSLFGAQGVDAIRDLLGAPLLDGIAEWTVEANPEDLDSDLLSRWRAAGVTRPHLGLQSLSGPALTWLGRLHDPEVGRDAMATLRASGFPTWGVDLLFALPREVDPDPILTIEEVVATEVPHISLYELVVDEGSELDSRVGGGIRSLPGEEERAEMYLRIATFLLREGYEAYEMTGFALPGHASRHAVALLEGNGYLGVGPGAESFVDGRLSRNLQDRSEYLGRISSGSSPEGEATLLDAQGAHFLEIWSRLRLGSGLTRSALSAAGRRLGDRWIREGVARADPERVALSLEGWLRHDGLALEMARLESID
jgi:oxygen-independent coproporphyrinogen-3 oxidase